MFCKFNQKFVGYFQIKLFTDGNLQYIPFYQKLSILLIHNPSMSLVEECKN